MNNTVDTRVVFVDETECSYTIATRTGEYKNDDKILDHVSLNENGQPVGKWEKEYIKEHNLIMVREYWSESHHDRRTICDCGSGKIKQRIDDGRGLFLCYTCNKCHTEKMKGYRADIMEPDYWHDEPLDCE